MGWVGRMRLFDNQSWQVVVTFLKVSCVGTRQDTSRFIIECIMLFHGGKSIRQSPEHGAICAFLARIGFRHATALQNTGCFA